jgi:hypothetical protein
MAVQKPKKEEEDLDEEISIKSYVSELGILNKEHFLNEISPKEKYEKFLTALFTSRFKAKDRRKSFFEWVNKSHHGGQVLLWEWQIAIVWSLHKSIILLGFQKKKKRLTIWDPYAVIYYPKDPVFSFYLLYITSKLLNSRDKTIFLKKQVNILLNKVLDIYVEKLTGSHKENTAKLVPESTTSSRKAPIMFGIPPKKKETPKEIDYSIIKIEDRPEFILFQATFMKKFEDLEKYYDWKEAFESQKMNQGYYPFGDAEEFQDLFSELCTFDYFNLK